MAKVVRIYEFGGPGVLKYEDADIEAPGPEEILLRQTAIGINFNEILLRQGLGSFPPGELPVILGREAAGVVEAVGENVNGLEVGQRVAYGMGGLGGYASERLIPASRVVVLPDSIEDKQAAAMMVKGLTAYYLLHLAYKVKAGDTILVHVVTGGVGRLLCNWARAKNVKVIGSVSSDDKMEQAANLGCNFVFNNQNQGFDELVLEFTKGEGVNAVYDPIGKDTFMGSLNCLTRRGSFVGFGDLSGKLDPVDPTLLMEKGSITFIRTSLRHFISTPLELSTAAPDLFDIVEKGSVKISYDQCYPLSDAAKAHSDIEQRNVSGTTLLLA